MACPNFKIFNHRCEEDICDRHLKVKLEISDDDWTHEGDVETLDGEERTRVETTTENEDAVGKEEREEEHEAMLDEIEYQESRKKVLQWFKRNDELERMSRR
jgi:hypothetical protein